MKREPGNADISKPADKFTTSKNIALHKMKSTNVSCGHILLIAKIDIQ